jgi:ABC-type branched-subunit amino acid transport system substrate-binding protein
MTSAPNLRQPSNGNNLWSLGAIFLCLLPVLTSCARKVIAAPTKEDTQIIHKNAGSNAPKTKTSNTQEPKIDTISYTESKSPEPIIIKPKKSNPKPQGANFKDVYNLKVLIPLKASETNGELIANNRFVQFYAGMLKAFEKLDDEDIKFIVEIIDTESDGFSIGNIAKIVNTDTDLIIGPYDKDEVKAYAEACKEAYIPMISPWYTSSKVTVDNPFYIQLKPNLREHFRKLALSAATEFKKGEVAIVGVNNKDTNAWVDFFQKEIQKSYGQMDFFKVHYVSETNLTQGSNSFGQMFTSGVKAVIIPNYSFSDETFVAQCMKRLSVEKGNKHITVFGMPMMYDADKIEFDLFKSLNVRIVISDFVDEREAEIKNFRRDFYDVYGEIPSADAIKGYDMMLYIGRNLWKYGKSFQSKLSEEATSYLLSTYNIVPTHSDDADDENESNIFDYYENKHLDIIQYNGNRFEVRR